jgi:hypothetical protein
LKKNGILNIIIIVFGVLLLYLQPIYFNYPIYYDSGVFSYLGSIINSNKLPYIDAWDHKGLWIYFYNAIGLKLWNDEIRGVYILEYISVVIALLISLRIIIKCNKFNPKIIQISLVGLIGSYALFFEGGNLPETIVFPWQIMFYTLALYVLNLSATPSSKSLFCLAFVAGMAIFTALLTRPNNAIGILVLTGFLFYKQNKLFKGYFLLILFSLFMSIGYYVVSSDLYNEIKINYIDFNLYYSQMNFLKRCKNAVIFTALLLASPIGIIASILIILNIHSIITKIKVYGYTLFVINKNVIFLIVLLADFLSQMVSGRVGVGYLHYTIMVLPALFVVLLIVGNTKKIIDIREGALYFKFIGFQVAAVIVSSVTLFHFNYTAYVNNYYLTGVKNDLILSIRQHSQENDTIYVSWANAWIYVASRRYSFTRYFYPTPVLLSAFDGRDRLAILMKDYKDSPPQLLVDWNNELFVKDLSIQYLTDKFASDYTLVESNSLYSIYKPKIATQN